ncbi:hypothetical protein [Streptomyces sp. YIM S03343]
MTNIATSGSDCPPGSKMTMRVYIVDSAGVLREDRGTVSVPYGTDLPPIMPLIPPCECQRCRAGLDVR